MRPQFRYILAASGASNLADGIFSLALPLVALSITRDPVAFASVTLVGRLPWLFFSLPAGAFADLADRRKTMAVVSFLRAAVLAAFASFLFLRSGELWILYGIAFALGIGETLFDTAGQSILPNIVPSDQLNRANGRLQAVELTTNRFIGPPLGAFIAGLTLAGAIASSSVLYLVAAVFLFLLQGAFKAERQEKERRFGRDIHQGISYLLDHGLLRVLAICVGVSNLASAGMISILPLQLVNPGPVGLSEAGYGLVLTTIAIGSIVGIAVGERIHRVLGTRRSLLLATASFPLFSLTPALTTSVPILVAGFFTAGAISVHWNIITVSIRQRIVPDRLLGRINSVYRLVAWGTMPIGAAVAGITASVTGVTDTLLVLGGISSICFFIVLMFIPDRQLKHATENNNE